MKRLAIVAGTCLLLLAVSGIFQSVIAHDHLLPLGDGHLSDAPRVGYLFDCQTRFNTQRAAHSGPWIRGDEWVPEAKPAVEGDVAWPNSIVSVTIKEGKRIIRANNLPQHRTGIFPIQADDPAYQYDHNPNAIRAQKILLTLPANPTLASRPSCVPMGMIGFALDGVAIYNAADAAGRDAVAHEIQDKCHGHPQHDGQYHYHGPSPCMPNEMTSGLVGYALDGFGIYGMKDPATGRTLHNSDLDACHGTTSTVIWDGKPTRIYHYVLTEEYPYTVGCFRGSVDPALLRHGHMRMRQRDMNREPMRGPTQGDRETILTKAAAALGVSVTQLREALGPPPPDFRRAAQELGISETELRNAMRRAREQSGDIQQPL